MAFQAANDTMQLFDRYPVLYPVHAPFLCTLLTASGTDQDDIYATILDPWKHTTRMFYFFLLLDEL